MHVRGIPTGAFPGQVPRNTYSEDLEVQSTSTGGRTGRLYRHIHFHCAYLKPQRVVPIYLVSPLQFTADQPDQLPQTRLLLFHRNPPRSKVPTTTNRLCRAPAHRRDMTTVGP